MKSKFSLLKSFLLSKHFVLLMVLLCVYLVFHKAIESFFDTFLVDSLLSKVESTWYNDLVFIAIVALSIAYPFFKKHSRRYSYKTIALFLFVALIYSVYRFLDIRWSFVSFYVYASIKYLDVILVLALSQICLTFIGTQKNRQQISGVPFFVDEPIDKKDEDKLGYEGYATLIANKINATETKGAFAIGIDGKWGTGKSSFIKLMRHSIDKEQIIEVEFNPWNSNTPSAIIEDFFDTLKKATGMYDATLSKVLIDYSNKLISINNNKVTQSVHTIISNFIDSKPLSEMFIEINDHLRRINKKIVIYIDDVDRLNNEEIVEVIRLIRNTANFYGTFFLVAYDRNYIVSALKGLNNYRAERFLEKIFQLEIKLPHFNQIKLKEELIEKLSQAFPAHTETIKSSINEIRYGNQYDVYEYWLDNMRDVTRLSNALILNSEKLFGEVLFKDLIKIEFLRMKYPGVHELLHMNTNEFFVNSKEDIGSDTGYSYRLKRDESKKTILGNHLECAFEGSISKTEIEKIIDLLDSIFRSPSRHGQGDWRYSIIYPSRFKRYFAYGIMEGELSEIEFSIARESSLENFQIQISGWVGAGLEKYVLRKFFEIENFDGRNDFEKVIGAIFYLARHAPKSRIGVTNAEFVLYDHFDLFRKICNKQVPEFYNSKHELDSFIRSMFEDVDINSRFESDFLHYVNTDYMNSDGVFPLSKVETIKLALGYFDKSCNSETFDWNLFHNTRETSRGEYSNEAKALAIKAIETSKLDNFLVDIRIREPFEESRFSISGIVPKIFDDWQSFKEFLNRIDEQNWTRLSDFKKFFELFEQANYTSVLYTFKD